MYLPGFSVSFQWGDCEQFSCKFGCKFALTGRHVKKTVITMLTGHNKKITGYHNICSLVRIETNDNMKNLSVFNHIQLK